MDLYFDAYIVNALMFNCFVADINWRFCTSLKKENLMRMIGHIGSRFYHLLRTTLHNHNSELRYSPRLHADI